MPDINEHEEGMLCWADLSTTDLQGAKRFYGELLGWSFEDMPAPEGGGTYSMARMRGRYTGAASVLPEEMRAQGVPPFWMSYIAVKDVDARLKKAEAAGGKVTMPPFDIPDAGRMALITDPTGATLALWQAGQHKGAGIMNEPGTLCWTELLTNDPKQAAAFYSEVFGWKPKTGPHEQGEYTEWMVGDTAAGGMMKNPMPGAPSFWSVYFTVAGCDASVKKAQAMGAQVHVPPTNIPKVGRFSMLRDPQGATFSVLKSDPNQQ